MPRKVMLSPNVVNTDEYLAMSQDARELYFHLLTDADTVGAITGIVGASRRYGYPNPEPIIAELERMGYLLKYKDLEHGTVYFVLHWWVHNNHDSCKSGRSPYRDLAAQLFGIGVEAKGELIRMMDCPNWGDSGATAGQTQPQDSPGTARKVKEGNATEQNEKESNVYIKEKRGGAALSKCPECGGAVNIGTVSPNGFIQYECMENSHMGWFNPETGETKENPYQ